MVNITSISLAPQKRKIQFNFEHHSAKPAIRLFSREKMLKQKENRCSMNYFITNRSTNH